MRVLTVLPCRFWGGPEKQTLQLALWLREHRKIDTIFAVMPPDGTTAGQNPLLVKARQAGFEATLFLQRRRYDVFEGLTVLRALASRYRPDVVCATGYKADVLGACLRDVPTIAMARGWTGEDVKVRFFEWLDRKSLRRHDAVTVVSNSLREQALREGCASDAVFRVPNAIDSTRLPEARNRQELCAELKVDPKRPLLGAVGRLSPEKGHRVLLEAFRVLKRTLPEAQLVLVGDGPEEAALRRQAEELAVSQSLTFAGLRSDGQQILGALDVIALPSFSEGMPNVVLEAFAYGVPVVATAVGGVPDMVEDPRTGWLVPPGEPEGLASALRLALCDRAEANRRAEAARSTITERFTPEAQGAAFLRAVAWALGSDATR